MKFALTLLVIASLASLAVFGFFAMGSHHTSSAIHDCLAAAGLAKNAAACPSPVNLSAFLEFHVGSFAAYSTAIVSAALSLLGLFAAFFILRNPALSTLSIALPGAFREFALVRADSRRDLVRWQVIREKRDPS
jgi:hypothetical protein